MTDQQSFPTCPGCGSESATKIAQPDVLMAGLEGIDLERAGTFRCEFCAAEYSFEAMLQLFSTKARCPDCLSYETKTLRSYETRTGAFRYHVCAKCDAGFKTRAIDRRSA